MTAPGGSNIPGGAQAAQGPQPWVVQPNSKPHLNVVLYLDQAWAGSGRYRLMYHRGAFYRWTGTHWSVLDTDTLSADIYDAFEHAVYMRTPTNNNPSTIADYDINPARLDALLKGVKNKVLVDRSVDTPCWLDGNERMDPPPKALGSIPMHGRDMLACTNAIVHLPTRQWFQHTPRLLNHFAVSYAFDPAAPRPTAWLDFLHSIWPDDSESIDCLQEMFGYLLTARNEQQKMFMLYGPKRAGKGTILRVMQELLGGNTNVTSTTVAQLNTQFGLANLEDKTVAIMSDLRFRSKDDGVAVENLLKITGEDPVLIDKKFKDPYQAKLATRFVIASNELPKMKDESGALQSRIILFKFVESFLGREDQSLADRLMAELSGILNWALDGLDRLTARGRFVQPKSGAEDLEVITGLMSPVSTFIEDYCVLGFDQEVPRQDLFDAWRQWCDLTGTFASDMSNFGKNLRAAVPSLKDHRSTGPVDADGKRTRPRIWQGIGLNAEARNKISIIRGFN